MKKILIILAVFTMGIIAKAEITDISNVDYAIYVTGTVQSNGTGKLSVMMKNVQPVMTFDGYITLPNGITVTGVTSLCPVDVAQNTAEGELILVGAKAADVCIPASTTPVAIATLDVTVSDIETGTFEVANNNLSLGLYPTADGVYPENVISSITVQKTAVIEDQDPDYALEAVPFVLAKDATSSTISVNLRTNDEVAYIDFDVEYPAGISPKEGARGGYERPTINTHRLASYHIDNLSPLSPNAPTFIEGTTYHYNLNNGDIDTFNAKESGYAMSIPISLSGVPEGVYTIKLKNISVKSTTDYKTFTNHTGEYYFSVVVGQPSAEEAILYGHYDNSNSQYENFSTALKNVAIADVTVATVDDGAKFTDVLVNEKGGNSYYTRTAANFATTVLPLNLTKGTNVDELYEIDSMDADGIVLKEAEDVAANTPCIFKGTINVEGATPILGDPSEQGLGQTTFKGTYSATSIAEGAGYYISGGAFYGDGAAISPFRGYFDGAIAGVKSLSIKLNTADGLIDITDQLSDEDIYSLQGIRMSNAQKGINIKGGKKVYVK